MTRFGENSPRWQKFASLWQFFECVFGIWQNFESLLKFVMLLGYFHRSKRPNIVKAMKPSGHTVLLQKRGMANDLMWSGVTRYTMTVAEKGTFVCVQRPKDQIITWVLLLLDTTLFFFWTTLLGCNSGLQFWFTFLGCASGLNFAADLGPVLALFIQLRLTWIIWLRYKERSDQNVRLFTDK